MAGATDTRSEISNVRPVQERAMPHLYLEIECERPRAGPAWYRLAGHSRVRIGRGDAREASLPEPGVLDVAVPDAWMSTRHAEIDLRPGGWALTDLGSKNGTLRNGERVTVAELADGDRLQLGHTLFRFHAALRTGAAPAVLDARELASSLPALRTMSPRFARIAADVRAVAGSRAPVLICGESGTGKELVARAIHEMSGRRATFVAVNCGAIPRELIESELFGHRKGAFSGATADRLGFVRQSDGGTLFLDEIGDLPLPAQAALLRMLQESQATPVGSDRPVDVDLRVVSATHRQLARMVREGTFRHDLLARLDGVRLELPALRDRDEDVPLLIAGLLDRLAPDRPDLALAPDAAQALLEYHWPLNVRELEHALESALARAGGRPISRADLPRAVTDTGGDAEPSTLSEADERQRSELLAKLGQHRGNLSAVARAMGKHRTQILRWMERYGLDADRFRGG
ncbi:MAG TPA: sigma 54-interacting transcriptional regulator [Kofleriaceae bacterium]